MDETNLNNPELVDEYLSSLQQQLDSLQAKNERLERRIRNLENQRADMRSRLPRRQRRKLRPVPTPQPVDRSISIPGVGELKDVGLPDGPVARPNLLVGAVLDDFSRSAFRYEFELRDIPARSPEETLEEMAPDLVLVESAYRGQDGSWAARIARFGGPSAELERLTEWCQSHSVPTVFWNKEDPINHDWFSVSASLFDVVLTVDSNMVDVYRQRLGHDRVGVLPFAAQPVIHYPPLPDGARPGHLAFAGSYYAAKHPERRAQIEIIVEPALEAGLQIFDRMDRQEDPRFAWPDRYLDHIVGSLTYPQTLEAYRRYQTFLNVNTITDSPTMCARRVYELLASGTRVISGPAQALRGVPVEIAHTPEETRNLLYADPQFEPKDRMEWVQSDNTMSHRVETIVEYI